MSNFKKGAEKYAKIGQNILKDVIKACKLVITPIHKEGAKFIIIFAAVTAFFSLFSSTLALIGLVLTLWCVYFFRDPTRFTLDEEGTLVSPADGVISEVVEKEKAPKDLNLSDKKTFTRITIFLNVFDVHVNRIPISGKITCLVYKAGKFLSANLPQATKENEQQIIELETKQKDVIVFSQIAGMVARRIVCDLKEDQEVKIGERFGIIRFGSRCDVYLPDNYNLKVLKGQKMIGGETILAQRKSGAATAVGGKKTTAKKTNEKKVK